MYNIVLVCEHGASTSMLTNSMKEAALKMGVDAEINAFSYSKLDEVIEGVDLVLLGPQVRFRKAQIEEKYADSAVKFAIIDTVDYGMMNGEKVLKYALENLEE